MKVQELSIAELTQPVEHLFEVASEKTLRLNRRWKASDSGPVFTIEGVYGAIGWTQWTQGFQYGNALIIFEATGNTDLLRVGVNGTRESMTEHLSHTGVHDHGFNTISTYGQLRRLILSGRIPKDVWQLEWTEQAIKVSGAVQAARWTPLADGLGFIHSFNGPQSLFIDTIRTLRVLAVSHALGHTLLSEQDVAINLLERLWTHARTTAQFNIFYGRGRDHYDVPALRGRTVHETLFNPKNGAYRAPSSQQGYSPFTTWTRGLAWAILGYAEELEFIESLPESHFGRDGVPAKADFVSLLLGTAKATADFYIAEGTALDGVCYWDTGAPELHRLGDWKAEIANPYNRFEPVDSSASAIAAQGLLRLGHYLGEEGSIYTNAGLTTAKSLLNGTYLASSNRHEGILLHSVYHRPNGWDYIPHGSSVPNGESCMWGDYHLLELGLLLRSLSNGEYYTFFR
jgi:unsaturated chondroitin disaccharide hydrolase